MVYFRLEAPWAYYAAPISELEYKVMLGATTTWSKELLPKEYLQHAHQRLPIGLISRVIHALHAHGFQAHVTSQPVPRLVRRREAFRNGMSLRPLQVGSLDAAEHYQRCFVYGGTNFGKTLVIAGLCRDYPDARITIFSHRQELLDQTREDCLIPCLDEEVGVVTASKWEPRRVTIAMVKTLISRMRHRRKAGDKDDPIPSGATMFKSPAYKLVRGTDIALWDEQHVFTTPTGYWLSQLCPAPIRIGFTGSPWRREDPLQWMRLEAMTGPPAFYAPTHYLASIGLAATTRAYFVPWGGEHLPVPAESWPECYDAGVVRQRRRTVMAAWLARASMQAGRTTVVVFERHEHGGEMQAILRRWGYDLPYLDQNATPEARRAIWQAMAAKRIPGAVSSLVCKEGLNIDPIRTIIYTPAGKSNQEIEQVLGRGARLKKDGGEEATDWIDFWDDNSVILEGHSKERASVLAGAGWPVYHGVPAWVNAKEGETSDTPLKI